MRRRLLVLLALLFAAAPVLAQPDLTGAWSGTLDQSLVRPGAPPLTIVVHFERKGDGYGATYDTPEQATYGVPVDSVVVEGDALRAVLVPIGGVFAGTVEADGTAIAGTWTQGPAALPLVLTPVDEVAETKPKTAFKPGDLSGTWTGAIARSTGGESRITLVLTRQAGSGYTAGYVPPGQTTPIDLGPVELDGEVMTIAIGVEATFTGVIQPGETVVEGTFGQGGDKRPMTLTRE